jgi:hypothetical protein
MDAIGAHIVADCVILYQAHRVPIHSPEPPEVSLDPGMIIIIDSE